MNKRSIMFVAAAGALMLSLAACNALWFHIGPYQGVNNWQTNANTPLAAKASAALSLLLWVGIICCGRLLAYL